MGQGPWKAALWIPLIGVIITMVGGLFGQELKTHLRLDEFGGYWNRRDTI